MGALKNEKHEAFCVLIASGEERVAAYVIAAEKTELAPGSARKGAKRWLKRTDIKNRVSELKVATIKESSSGEIPGSLINRERAMLLLSAISLDPEIGASVRIKAIERLGKMEGWDAASEIEHSGDVIFVSNMGVSTKPPN